MACLSPRIAYYDTRGEKPRVLFKPLSKWFLMDSLPEGVESIEIPCGKCFACLKSRSLSITVRAVAESRMHDFSSFITLTVDDEHMSTVFPHGLEHRPWQLFAKRLRKKIGSFSFLMCGEYGARTMRPHYHAIIFGHKFVDSDYDSDYGLIGSKVLKDCWPHGHHSVSDVNSSRLAYVAGYTCKDFALGRDKRFYQCRGLGLPYVRWSRNPSLGLRWLKEYRDDLLDDDYCLSFVLDGKQFRFGCRYFVDKLRLLSPDDYDNLVASRRERLSCVDDLTGIMRHENLKRSCELKQYQLKQKRHTAEI